MNIFKIENYQHYSKKTVIDMAKNCPKHLYDTLIDKLYFHQPKGKGWNRKKEEYEVLSPRRLSKVRRREISLDDIIHD